MVYLEHKKSMIWCAETWNSREAATDSGPQTWWWVDHSVIRKELPGWRLHVGIDLRDHGAFISSSFCKAHFYELVQPAVEHYIHHIDRKFQGLGTEILTVLKFLPSVDTKIPQRYTCLSTLVRCVPSPEVLYSGQRHGLGAGKSSPNSFISNILICNMGTINYMGQLNGNVFGGIIHVMCKALLTIMSRVTLDYASRKRNHFRPDMWT